MSEAVQSDNEIFQYYILHHLLSAISSSSTGTTVFNNQQSQKVVQDVEYGIPPVYTPVICNFAVRSYNIKKTLDINSLISFFKL
jgi:hypothetical protein